MELTVTGERRRCMGATLASGARAFAVCDGFGAVDGMPIEEAALRQLQHLLQGKSRAARFGQQLQRPKAVTSMLVSLFARVNNQLYVRGASHDDYVTCGASMTMVLLAGERAYLAHLGNTAAYLSRGGYMISLTKDDSCVFDVPVGRAVAVSAHPPVLTRALGAAPNVELSVCSFRIAGDDAIVLASKRLAGFEDRRALSAWLLRGEHRAEFADRTIAVIPAYAAQMPGASVTHAVWAQVAAGVAFLLGLLLIS